MYAVPFFPGIVVQLVRAPPCQGGSCGFESRQSRWIQIQSKKTHQFILCMTGNRNNKKNIISNKDPHFFPFLVLR
uniref:Uncharacterized protein n=1 Tax=Lotus japonicus TaxID=34305 RepID=I3S2A0_LOTJA|nr:unknown [Lotus japonicus]